MNDRKLASKATFLISQRSLVPCIRYELCRSPSLVHHSWEGRGIKLDSELCSGRSRNRRYDLIPPIILRVRLGDGWASPSFSLVITRNGRWGARVLQASVLPSCFPEWGIITYLFKKNTEEGLLSKSQMPSDGTDDCLIEKAWSLSSTRSDLIKHCPLTVDTFT